MSNNSSMIVRSLTEGWRLPLLCLSFLLVILVAAFQSTWASIINIWWNSETYAHGFLVIPIVVYLIWRKRHELMRSLPKANGWAGLLLLALIIVWSLARLVNILVIEQVALVAMIPVLVWMIIGTSLTAKILFPLGFLIFAVPMGEALVPVMQDFTAYFTVKALQLTGLPVYWEGRFISIPSGNFEVAEACSGVRYLIASVVLGTLYAYISYQSIWRRIAFIMLSIIVPIIANGARAYGIVMLAHLSGYKLAVGVDHLIYGWLFFGIVMFLLFWVGTFFAEGKNNSDDLAAVAIKTGNINAGYFIIVAIVSAMILITASAVAAWLSSTNVNIDTYMPQLPQAANGWTGPSNYEDTWKPIFNNPSAELKGIYTKGEREVFLYIVYYATQRQGDELIGSQNRVFDGEIWVRQGEDTKAFTIEGGHSETVHVTSITSATQQRMVWHWYEIDGVSTINGIMAKLLELRSLLTRSHYGSIAIVIASDYEINVSEANDTLNDFLITMRPSIRESLYVNHDQR